MNPSDRITASFGYFQSGGSEFVITEPNPPRGLMNYSWNDSFISAVNQIASGVGAYKERAAQLIHPAGRALLIRDGQRHFYLRDKQSGETGCPTGTPIKAQLEDFRCEHGPGYSNFRSTLLGIELSMRWFVPSKQSCEIWSISLRNTRETAAEIQLFSFVNFLLQGYSAYSDYYSYIEAEFLSDSNAVHIHNRAVERPHKFFDGFIASNRPPSAFDSSLRQFLGNFGGIHAPEAILQGACLNSLAACEKACGVLQHEFKLAPGETENLSILIGSSSGPDKTAELCDELFSGDAIESEFSKLLATKAELRNRITIKTPNPKVDAVINNWIKQQIQVYAEVGSDNGRGFRDAMQLLWAAASFNHDYVKKMLDECLRHQFSDGHTLRGWLPVDDHHYSDGPVWIAPVLDAYIKETNDTALLDKLVPFFDEGEASIWDHMLRGLRHSALDIGEHGLIRCHYGDWNDSLNGVGIEGLGQSVWTTIAIIYSCKVGAELARKVRNDETVAEELLGYAKRLTNAVNSKAWDGEWYLRAINDHGEHVGSKKENEGRIYLLPQVWAILADITDDKRKAQLFRMIDEHLDSPYGSKVLHPPYTRPNDRIGRLTHFVPGIWENGSPYCHANGFKIIADCVGGRGDHAYASFIKALPDSPSNPSTHSGCEPYVFPNQYLGPENPRAGETQFAWMTGTAGWYYRAMTEWMIGVRADHDGLMIDPCLPSHWKECSLERDFRGSRYRIKILNPEGLQKGQLNIEVDGTTHQGNQIPIYNDGKTHEVSVTLLKERVAAGVPE